MPLFNFSPSSTIDFFAGFNGMEPNDHLHSPNLVSDKEEAPTLAKFTEDPNAFPDGGFQAWFCIAGGWCTVFSSFGWVNCTMKVFVLRYPLCVFFFFFFFSLTRLSGIGVFQDYYQAHQLASYDPSDVAWIPATEGFMLFFFVRLYHKTISVSRALHMLNCLRVWFPES